MGFGIVSRVTLISILAVGCSSTKEPGAVTLPENYETFQGLRAAAPELKDGDERLDIFIGVLEEIETESPVEEEVRFKEVLYCVAINKEEEPLPEVHALIEASPANKTIYIYGKRVEEKYKFWWDGLDCVATAIAVWHPKARRYMYYDLEYGTPVWESLSMRKALKNVVEGGMKKAVRGALP